MPNNFPILVGSTTDCAKEQRSDYVWETRTSYIGTASEGSSISENVWCITKIVIKGKVKTFLFLHIDKHYQVPRVMPPSIVISCPVM